MSAGENTKEAYERAALAARETAAKARDAADAFEELAEQLGAGNIELANTAHQKAVNSFARAQEAAATCDDWLTKAGESY